MIINLDIITITINLDNTPMIINIDIITINLDIDINLLQLLIKNDNKRFRLNMEREIVDRFNLSTIVIY